MIFVSASYYADWWSDDVDEDRTAYIFFFLQ